ncbi:MAG: zinc ABC transporter substrate-binding protein [Verrucomicrobiales bacterium]|nr:zinc ABC transporter substrate-binding protein [Verrucomicrobiales bacterium]
MKTWLTSLLAVISLGLIGQAAEKPLVYVPVLPYEFLFEKIAGDMVEIRTIVSEGDDCHDYSPTPKQIAQISKANLLFSGDLGFESNFFVKVGDGKTAPKAVSLLEGLNLLDGSCEICEAAAREAAEHDHHEDDGHKHEAHHHHDHGELKDPHVWLSPKMLKQQSDRVASVLKPFLTEEQGKEIDKNVANFKEELDSVDNELRTALEPLKGQKFYVYHGAFAYFALDYGLEQVAIEIGNRRPTPKQISGIAQQAQKDGVKIIFVQPQFDQSSANSLAQTIKGEVATLDPLEKDVIANLRKIAASVAKIH